MESVGAKKVTPLSKIASCHFQTSYHLHLRGRYKDFYYGLELHRDSIKSVIAFAIFDKVAVLWTYAWQ